MLYRLLLLSILIIQCFSLAAQRVEGIVKSAEGQAQTNASVTLRRVGDSLVIKGTTTDNTGKFYFDDLNAGQYSLLVSHIGFSQSINKLTLSQSKLELPDIILLPQKQQLQAVEVVAQKPLVEMRADRLIVNVDGTINAVGSDALDLLRKSPGVVVDKDDNLSVSGKTGVQVFIDGKPSPLAGADLGAYLRTLQSTDIDVIEIITNPGAKYEAAGNAGIINIRLKKNKNYGTNGSATAGLNFGITPKYNTGFTINNRNKQYNIFGSYNYNNNSNRNEIKFYREQADTIFDQKNDIELLAQTHTYKAGIDFFASKQTTVGVMVNGIVSDSYIGSYGAMNIGYKPLSAIDRVLVADNTTDGVRNNTNVNANFRHLSKTGRELNIDADHGSFDISSNQYQPNFYFKEGQTQFLYSNIYRMISPSIIKISSLKADYEQPFLKGKLGFGAKTGYVKTDNDFNRFDVLGSQSVKDLERSNRFVYNEKINAGYVNFNRQYKVVGVQVGLRGEYTNVTGQSLGFVFNPTSNKFDDYDSTTVRKYFDLFPSAAITFTQNKNNKIGVTYSRRIDRPAYQDLNPFEFKLNDYTFTKGNIALRPQYSNNFAVSHTYKAKLITTVGYSHVKDIFAQISDTAEVSKSFLTKRNLATQDIVSLNISYPIKYKRYNGFINSNSYHSNYKADYGAGNRTINISVTAINFAMQNSIKLGNGFTAEVNGFYNSPSIWQGTFRSKSMYAADAGFQKLVLGTKGNIKLSVTDVFKTMRWAGVGNFTGVTSISSGRWESRQLKLFFTYRFGNGQVKAARSRKTGTEEENKRTQGAGGVGAQ